jgi:predicted Zn-dependent protease
MKQTASAILVIGLIFAIVLARAGDSKQDDQISFVPFFTMVGRATQGLERGIGALPLNTDQQEKDLGQQMKVKYVSANLTGDDLAKQKYLSTLLERTEQFRKKNFEYEIFYLPSSQPNAMALPGGIILVTDGLLNVLKSEAELVAVIAHEIGHIEYSHCRDSVKFQLMTQKLKMGSVGELADFANALLVRHSYSKNQEDEADQFSLNALQISEYDPTTVGLAFRSLKDARNVQGQGGGGPFRDYFMSHPPLEDREAKNLAQAASWWSTNAGAQRYRGVTNLIERTAYPDLKSESEWVAGFQDGAAGTDPQ